MEILNIPFSIEQFSIATALLVFTAYLIIDAMYAYYILSVDERKPYRAATTGAIMHFLLAFGVLSYVQNFIYIFPIAIGSWLGTFIVIKNKKTKNGPTRKNKTSRFN